MGQSGRLPDLKKWVLVLVRPTVSLGQKIVKTFEAKKKETGGAKEQRALHGYPRYYLKMRSFR